ncbi:MAG: hypothetical protein ACE5LC_05290 [Candidatus Aminicenantales bacterium]
MKRYQCPDCSAVHTVRPQGYYRGFQYSVLTILGSFLSWIVHGCGLRSLHRQAQQS